MTDLSWGLLRHGYDAVSRDRASRNGGDDYRSRLLGRRTVVVRSRDGARAFYDESLVRRAGAVPPPLAWLLFGRGAVHGLDDVVHRDRKLLFLDVLSPGGLASLFESAEGHVREAFTSGPPGGQVCVFDRLVVAYGRAVLEWAGLELDPDEAARVSRRLAAIVDGFGGAGSAYPRAWAARRWADRWAARLVRDVRSGRVTPKGGSALTMVAKSADLDARTAGVELLNVLRPTVAVAWLGTFAAARLSEHPGCRERLREPDGVHARLAFAEEVRRTTPFVPVLAGRVRRRGHVAGHAVRPGDRIVLDVIGIDHDPARWLEPGVFEPERFDGLMPGAFDLVPQGGGHPSGHRCPGESVALGLLDVTVRVLAEVDYTTGTRRVDRRRIPTLPADGLLIRPGALTRLRPARTHRR